LDDLGAVELEGEVEEATGDGFDFFWTIVANVYMERDICEVCLDSKYLVVMDGTDGGSRQDLVNWKVDACS